MDGREARRGRGCEGAAVGVMAIRATYLVTHTYRYLGAEGGLEDKWPASSVSGRCLPGLANG